MGSKKYETDNTAPINVLATDYDNWSVSYQCSYNGAGLHFKSVSIWDRKGAITDAQLKQAE